MPDLPEQKSDTSLALIMCHMLFCVLCKFCTICNFVESNIYMIVLLFIDVNYLCNRQIGAFMSVVGNLQSFVLLF